MVGVFPFELDLADTILSEPVAAILNCLREEGLERYSRKGMEKPLDASEVWRFLGNPSLGCRVFAAKIQTTLTGLAICQTTMSSWRLGRILNIHDLYVSPSFRNKGIGTCLLDFLEATAREEGFVGVSLETNLRNHAAIRMYMRRGYTSQSARFQKSLGQDHFEFADHYPDLAIPFHLDLGTCG